MSAHPFQQLITYIYKYTCTCYAYIIDNETSIQTKSWIKYFIDSCLAQ